MVTDSENDREAPRALTSAACLARSADRARLWLSPIRIHRSTDLPHIDPGEGPTSLGPAWYSRRPPSPALRYWNMARQRYCRRLARYRNTRPSLPTRAPSQPRTPARKSGVLDLRKWVRPRDRLSAGGRWIRTSSSARDRLHFDV